MATYLQPQVIYVALRAAFGVGLAVSLVACSNLTPINERPSLALPDSLLISKKKVIKKANQAEPISSEKLQQWWESLQDPSLNRLIAEALANNQDMAIAAARIAEARATAQVASANRAPTLDANFASSRTRLSESAGKVGPGAAVANNDFQLGLTAAYEVDFWGKYQNADRAAQARLLAQEANRHIVQSGLVANVVQTYCSLLALDSQIALTNKLRTTRKNYLELLNKRLAAGMSNQIEINTAKAENAQVLANLTQLQMSRSNLEATLAALLGRSPKDISQPEIAREKLDKLYKKVRPAVELPSELLQRRPDILAAEANLLAANADVSQAKALYFPSLRLTTSIGHESRQLEDLFSPSALLWNLAASVTQPIFRAGSLDAVVNGANARKTQAQAQYVQTVQGAFRDVHEALGNMQSWSSGQLEAKHRYQLARDSQRLVAMRQQSGLVSNLELLNAERDQLQAQNALIDNQRGHLLAMVALYKALGGGWGGVN